MKCQSCGSDLTEGMRFCSNCGAPVSQPDNSAVETNNASENSVNIDTNLHSADNASVADTNGTPVQPTVPQNTAPQGDTQQGAAPQNSMLQNPQPSLNYSAFINPVAIRTSLISALVGFAGLLVTTVLMVIIISIQASVAAGSAPSMDSLSSDGNANIVTVFILLAGLFAGGSVSVNSVSSGSSLLSLGDSSASAQIALPATLATVVMLLAAAFMAYNLAKTSKVILKWSGLVASVLSGLIVSLGFFLISLFASISQSGATLSVATGRTFIMLWITLSLGVIAGTALANLAPDATNVFTALKLFISRARGFVRTALELSIAMFVVFNIVALVVVIILSIASHQAATANIIIFLPAIALDLLTLGGFGALQAQTDAFGMGISLSVFGLSPKVYTLPTAITLCFVACVLVFLVMLAIVTLRACARTLQDPSQATWSTIWKLPVTICVEWLLVVLLYASITLSASGSLASAIPGLGSVASAISGTIAPALWTLFLAAVWAVVIEAVRVSSARSIFNALPNLWQFASRGMVQETPAEVLQWQSALGVTCCNTQPTMPNTTQPVATEPSAQQFPATAAAEGTVPAENTVPAAAGTQQPTTVLPVTPAAPATAQQSTVAGQATTMQFAAPSQPKPMSKKTKRILIATGAAVLLCAVLAVAYSVVSATVFSPKPAVENYLTSLSSGNWNEATRTVDPGIKKGERLLLQSKFAKGKDTTMQNVEITEITKASDKTRVAKVQYTVDGSKQNAALTVERDGNQFLIFPKWKVTTPLLTNIELSTSSIINKVKLNNVEISTEDLTKASQGEGYISLAAYPGKYTLSLPESKYMTAEDSSVIAATGTSKPLSLEVTATPELANALQTALDERTQECIAGFEPGKDDDKCDYMFTYSMYDGDNYRNVKVSLDENAKIDDDSINLSSGTFSTKKSGTLKYTYQYNFLDEWEDEDGNGWFSAYGSFTIDGDKVLITDLR